MPFGESIEIQEHFRNMRPSRFQPAHMVYRIRGTRLYFASGAQNIRGGVMVIGTSTYTGGGPAEGLLDDIAAEIKKREFEGVVLDNGGNMSPIHTALAARIVSAFRPLPVYLSEQLASVVPGSVALIQTALSGGSLERHLFTAIERHGAGHVAVECDRICMDFKLPAKAGAGKSIDKNRLEQLLSRHKPFYSSDLYVRYFTYKAENSRHMVLYDDGESMDRKLKLAARLGISRAFLYYPNTYDIIAAL
ncbi:MAG: hypothetical protein GX823_03835 [Clostridiales bacterium]|nr:hypothetical protein [Clostridiales bacterium]